MTKTAEILDRRISVGRILGRTIQVLIGVALALACSVPAARAQVTSVEARIAQREWHSFTFDRRTASKYRKAGDVLFPWRRN